MMSWSRERNCGERKRHWIGSYLWDFSELI
jgi:hypothetical protein